MNDMKTVRIIAILILCVCSFVSCEVEFSPNDKWTEIPVVYCVLDQDDDTSFVRVQRCFLGEGNQYRYTGIYRAGTAFPGTVL